MTDKQLEVVRQVAKTNDRIHTVLKCVEELNELATVLMQSVIKLKDPPKDKDIVSEIGDVEVRLEIVKQYFSQEQIDKRVDYKVSKLKDYLEKGKYLNHI